MKGQPGVCSSHFCRVRRRIRPLLGLIRQWENLEWFTHCVIYSYFWVVPAWLWPAVNLDIPKCYQLREIWFRCLNKSSALKPCYVVHRITLSILVGMHLVRCSPNKLLFKPHCKMFCSFILSSPTLRWKLSTLRFSGFIEVWDQPPQDYEKFFWCDTNLYWQRCSGV
jgi:hypothetical protein